MFHVNQRGSLGKEKMAQSINYDALSLKFIFEDGQRRKLLEEAVCKLDSKLLDVVLPHISDYGVIRVAFRKLVSRRKESIRCLELITPYMRMIDIENALLVTSRIGESEVFEKILRHSSHKIREDFIFNLDENYQKIFEGSG